MAAQQMDLSSAGMDDKLRSTSRPRRAGSQQVPLARSCHTQHDARLSWHLCSAIRCKRATTRSTSGFA